MLFYLQEKDSSRVVTFHIWVPRVGRVNIKVEAKDQSGSLVDVIKKELRVEVT
jgi:hypothetical protein